MTEYEILAGKILKLEFSTTQNALHAVWEAFRAEKINSDEGNSLLCLANQMYPGGGPRPD